METIQGRIWADLAPGHFSRMWTWWQFDVQVVEADKIPVYKKGIKFAYLARVGTARTPYRVTPARVQPQTQTHHYHKMIADNASYQPINPLWLTFLIFSQDERLEKKKLWIIVSTCESRIFTPTNYYLKSPGPQAHASWLAMQIMIIFICIYEKNLRI